MKLFKNILLLSFLFSSVTALAQIDSLYVAPLDSTQLMNDLFILSADSLEGRNTNTLGNEKARNYIINRLQKIGVSAYVPGYIQGFEFENRKKDSISAKNILGYIQGFNSKDYIVLSAHYDHLGMKDSTEVFNGADDNASGVAALLLLADYFQQNQPNNNILFAFFDAEEMGLQGSKYFMQSVVVDSSLIKLNVNLDMVGRGDKNELYAVGTYFTPFLKTLIDNAAVNQAIKVLYGRDVPKKRPNWVNSSDHAPFHQAGIPFVYFGVDDHADYHKVTDTADKINPDFYLGAVKIIKKAVENFDANLHMLEYGK